MEVKIGVIDSPRELIVNSEQTPDEVETLVAAVLGGREPVLALVDDKGRKFLVQGFSCGVRGDRSVRYPQGRIRAYRLTRSCNSRMGGQS